MSGWDYNQRERIELAVDRTERNPPGFVRPDDPQAQLIDSPAQYAASIYLEDTSTFNSTDSGWNLVSDFYFHQVTNPTSSTTTGTDHSWNGIFDPRDSGGGASPLGMRLEAAGTYWGVIPIQYDIDFGTRTSFKIGEVQTLYQEPDTSNWTWRTSASAASETISFSDGVKCTINLLLTDKENTSHSTLYQVVGMTDFDIGPSVDNGTQDGTRTIPFMFSVDSDSAPVELQMWINIETSDSGYWDESGTQITINSALPTNNGPRGWIRYTPDEVSSDVRDEIATIPP